LPLGVNSIWLYYVRENGGLELDLISG
jgi:hypothetical protein